MGYPIWWQKFEKQNGFGGSKMAAKIGNKIGLAEICFLLVFEAADFESNERISRFKMTWPKQRPKSETT